MDPNEALPLPPIPYPKLGGLIGNVICLLPEGCSVLNVSGLSSSRKRSPSGKRGAKASAAIGAG